MAPLELMYFDGAGRANLTRMALIVGGVDFVDKRVTSDEWPTIKADSTSVPAQLFGSLPCLRDGDLLLAQSIALAAYAADIGMYAKQPPSATVRAVDLMVVTTNEELKQLMYKCLFGDDASKEAGKAALPEPAAKMLGVWERTVERRKSTDGPFFQGSTLTLADLAVCDSIYSPFPGLKALGIDLTPYPKVMACAGAVGQNEMIKAFVEKGWKM